MNLSMLDGYLAAVVCCPKSIPLAQWIKWVWDWECGEEVPEFESPSYGAYIVSLILRHWYDIVGTLEHAPARYVPLLLQEPKTKKPVIEEWCSGFMTGLRISKRTWKSTLTTHPNGFSTMQLFGTDEGFEIRGRKSPSIDEYRKLAHGIAESVRMIYSLSCRSKKAEPSNTIRKSEKRRLVNEVRPHSSCSGDFGEQSVAGDRKSRRLH